MSDIPNIDGKRCVHGSLEQASCQACVRACPQQAIRLTDEALTLDGGRCDGCGLCVPACPEQAISSPAEPVVRESLWGRGEVFAACSRAVEHGPGVLPCLNAIGLSRILSYCRHGISAWHIAHADCAECSHADTRSFHRHVEDANRILRSHKVREIRVTRMDRRAWVRRLGGIKVSADPARRRAFLRGVAERNPEKGSHDIGEGWRTIDAPTTGWLAESAGILPWSINLDARRCLGCDSCARVCPHGAISLEEDVGYVIRSARCTGCGVCQDVCSADAIRLERLSPAPQTVVPLLRSTCRRCGNPFRQPVGSQRIEYCHVCRNKVQSRQLFQVIS